MKPPAQVTIAQVRDRVARAWVPMIGQAGLLVLAANGHGKTGLITRVIYDPLLARERVVSVDVKGDDPMWDGYGAPVGAIAPGMIGTGAGPGGNWWRLVVDPLSDRGEAAGTVRAALRVARNEGHMVLVIDESRTLTDGDPQLGLRQELEDALRTGRSRNLRTINAAQSTEYMTASVRNQWAVAFIGALRDDDAVQRALKLAGLWQDRKLYMPIVRDMPPRTWLYIDRADGPPVTGIVSA